MSIKKYLLALVLASLATLGWANTAADQLSSLLKFQTLQAQFKQATLSGQRVLRRASGKMSVKRPGKFRWSVIKPMQTLLIINGTTAWNYDKDLMQATKQHLSKAQGLNAASLLSGDAKDLANNFQIKQEPTQGTKEKTFMLIPNAQTSFTSIQLSFEGQQLLSMQTTNALGQRTVFMFSKVSYNQPIADSLFKFKPPKGVDVLDNGK
ncbi:MAG: outer membrane lipoprotein chaperone LolA [Coxiellaceae bacterium]|nr:outer membrane lipoprotein chaperone LolA [Coxiellaceae bacterium]